MAVRNRGARSGSQRLAAARTAAASGSNIEPRLNSG